MDGLYYVTDMNSRPSVITQTIVFYILTDFCFNCIIGAALLPFFSFVLWCILCAILH